MRKEEYKRLYEVEDTHGWFSSMRSIAMSFIDKLCKNENVMILEVGCGTGALLSRLKKYDNSIGIDISGEALSFCKKRYLTKILRGSVLKLPFKENAFDLIICLNVLYHKQVDNDFKAIKEIHRVCKKEARVLIMNPAYNFLWSGHDENQLTRKRYTLREQRDILVKGGFRIKKATYLNMFLFPVLFVKRIFSNITENKSNYISEIRPLPGLLNSILIFALKLESYLIAKINLPFGSSVFCIGIK